MKNCIQCHEMKPLSAFNKRSSHKDGLNYYCHECERVNALRQRERKHRWYQANKEEQQARNRARKQKNRDQIRAYNKTYRARNKEQRNAYNRAWWAKNNEHARKRAKRYIIYSIVYAHKRRKLLGANGGNFTAQEWRDLCAHYDYRCLRCGKVFAFEKLTVDHVIPVTQNGANDIANLQPLCLICNSVKKDRAIDYRPVVAIVWPLLEVLSAA